MDNKILEALKDKSQEERASYLEETKDDVLSDLGLDAISGGVSKAGKENPNSEEAIYKGNYHSSLGYVCDGEVICGHVW